MLESLNYSFRNPKNIIWVIYRIKQLRNYKNHGVLRGPQLGKQRWRPRLGILRVKQSFYFTAKSLYMFRVSFAPIIRSLRLCHLLGLFPSMCRTIISYVCHCSPTCAYYLSGPFRPPWFDHPDHISWRGQVLKSLPLLTLAPRHTSFSSFKSLELICFA